MVYGGAMLAGATVLRFVRHRLTRIPIIGRVAAPVLGASRLRVGGSGMRAPASSACPMPRGPFASPGPC